MLTLSKRYFNLLINFINHFYTFKLLNWLADNMFLLQQMFLTPAAILCLLKIKEDKMFSIFPSTSLPYPTPASANFSAHALPRNQPFCERSNFSTSLPHQQEVLNSRSKRISNIWLSSYRSRRGILVSPVLCARNGRDTPSCFQRKFGNERNGRSSLAEDPSNHQASAFHLPSFRSTWRRLQS